MPPSFQAISTEGPSCFTVIVFKVSPALLTDLLPIHNTIVFVLVEGVIRVSLLIGYLALISLIPKLVCLVKQADRLA